MCLEEKKLKDVEALRRRDIKEMIDRLGILTLKSVIFKCY